jgi:dinuclear metal center YbgI/SA1388 family protein
MAVANKEIVKLVENLAPLRLAEEWDNSGWQLGDPGAPTAKVMLTLDITPPVVEEAAAASAGLIISHHPMFLKGLKNLCLDRPEGKLIEALIKKDIAVYSAHTNLDSAAGGVNSVLAEQLGLIEVDNMLPGKAEQLYKLVVFVPLEQVEQVRTAITEAGAGWIGNYRDCAFQSTGIGTFRPLEGSKPFIGQTGLLEKVEEFRLETIVPEKDKKSVIAAMLNAHPYEEVAYDLYPLANNTAGHGLGRIGCLPQEVSLGDFAKLVKTTLQVNAVRLGGNKHGKPVRKVAVCGGAGASLWKQALSKGADVYVTGDIKYHEALDMSTAGLSFIDAGHFPTERIILPVLYKYLIKVCSEHNFAVDILLSQKQNDVFVYV